MEIVLIRVFFHHSVRVLCVMWKISRYILYASEIRVKRIPVNQGWCTNSAPQLRTRYFLMRSQAISIWWSTLMKNPFKVSSSAELPIIKLWTCTFGICPSNIWKRESSDYPRILFVFQENIWIYFFLGLGKSGYVFFWRIHTLTTKSN